MKQRMTRKEEEEKRLKGSGKYGKKTDHSGPGARDTP